MSATGPLVAVAVSLAIAAPAGVGAQATPRDSGFVRGTVVDATAGAPVPNVSITLTPGALTAVTDGDGHFTVGPIPAGTYQATVQHLGYTSDALPVTVTKTESSFLRIELRPEPIAVEPLLVRVESERRPVRLERAGFYTRMGSGWGRFFDPGFMERNSKGQMKLGDFLERWAPIRLGRQRGRGFCQPVLYLNGRRSRTVGVEDYLVHEIAAIEFYQDTHGVPVWALDPDAACGTILLWTHLG